MDYINNEMKGGDLMVGRQYSFIIPNDLYLEVKEMTNTLSNESLYGRVNFSDVLRAALRREVEKFNADRDGYNLSR